MLFLQYFRIVILILFILINIHSFSLAGTTGKIAGRVTDEDSGEPLAGVNVIIENSVMGAATDLDGNFFIIGISPGIYTVIANYISYSDVQISQVHVNIDKTTIVNIEMRPAMLELDEAIQVVAERPLVKMDLTSTESNIGQDVIEALPVETLGDVVNLQAGVVDGHFRGGRSDEVLYMVNGVSINDVYSGSNEIEVENNSIQEVNVISGTFNAEYGQAMSGVVNVVTREGGPEFEGGLSGYIGDYISSNDDIFWNIEKPNLITNIQGTLGGPVSILSSNLSFFASGRYYHDSGYIYGRKVFVPSDHTEDFLNEDDPNERQFQSQGKTYDFSEELAQQLIKDSDAVSMNDNTRYTANLKLTYRLSPGDKLNLESIYQNQDWREYEHRFRLNPEGSYNYYRWSLSSTLAWNHVFNASTFLDVNFSYNYTSYQQNVYDDPYDSRYVEKMRLQDTGSNAFVSGGQQMWHFNRTTTTHLFKTDLTSQVTFNHQIKLGIEARRHRLWMHEFEIIPEIPGRIAPLTSFLNNRYLHYPIEMSAYIQDKMEFEDLIVNAGVRFDYFDPDGEVPLDFKNPQSSETRDAKTSTQLSPRLGLAYPISEKGVIHASYGHFFQTPRFFYLYTNPEFDIDPLQSSVSPPPESEKNTVGNPELKPQQTTIYEIGLQQQISDLYGFSLTVFFKDIRNLLGTEVLQILQGEKYGRYINRDYGFVRGITFDFERKFSDGIGASIDYTYQIAMGNASDPNNAFLDAKDNDETEKQVVPLDWDRRHQINAFLNLSWPDYFALSIITKYGTGFPYTPVSRIVQPYVENGGRKPDIITVDLYLSKDIQWAGLTYKMFLKVFNLFDKLNEQDVYSDTGRASYSTEPLYFGGERPRGLNTLEQYYVRPNYYSEPRQVQIGFEVKF